MASTTTTDGIRLHYEVSGSGTPVVFVHEFAGDHRAWEPQVRYLSRSHRCVAFASRGYPPSDVPEAAEAYSQDIARADVIAIMDALKIKKAHIVGHSMGAYTALHIGIHHPDRCLSVSALGCGWGSKPEDREEIRAGVRSNRRAVREGADHECGGQIRALSDARHVRSQGPQRVCRVRKNAGRTFRQGLRTDDA